MSSIDPGSLDHPSNQELPQSTPSGPTKDFGAAKPAQNKEKLPSPLEVAKQQTKGKANPKDETLANNRKKALEMIGLNIAENMAHESQQQNRRLIEEMKKMNRNNS